MGHRLHRPLLTDDATLKAVFDVLESVTDVAEDHVSRNLGGVRDHLETSADSTSRRPSISARTAAVSSHPIALSGR